MASNDDKLAASETALQLVGRGDYHRSQWYDRAERLHEAVRAISHRYLDPVETGDAVEQRHEENAEDDPTLQEGG
jgi:hypothetical protein